MTLRKIFATIIDLLVATVPAVIVGLYLNESMKMILYKIVFLYFFHTSLLLFISRKFTFGEKMMGLSLTTAKNDKVSFFVLLIRNLIFCFFIFLIALSWGSTFEVVLWALMFFSMNFVSLNNQYKQPMTAVDFIFKTYYFDARNT